MTPRPQLKPGQHGTIAYARRGGVVEASAYIRDHDGERRRVKASGRDNASARDALVAKLALRSAGLGGAKVDASMSVRDLSLVWLVGLRGKSQATMDTYARVLRRYIVPALGDTSVADAAPAAEPFLDRLAGDAVASARLARIVLRGVFALAVDAGVLPSNPVGKSSAAEAAAADAPRVLTRVEFFRLRSLLHAWQEEPTAGHPRGRDLLDQIDFMLGTRARMTEVLAARWDDLDLSSSAPFWLVSGILDRSAGLGLQRRSYGPGEIRRAPLPGFVVSMLQRRRTSADGPLVFSNRSGRPVDPTNVRRSLIAAVGDRFDWIRPDSLASIPNTVPDPQPASLPRPFSSTTSEP